MNQLKVSVRTVVISVVAAGLLAGCSSGSGSSSPKSSSGGSSAASGPDIKIAESAALSGSAGAYGKAVVDGQEAMLDAVNAAGGVNGRKIKLEILDDALDPGKAVQNTKTLLADGNVAFLEGTGSGTLNSMEPLLVAKNVPMLFPAKTDIGWVDTVHPMIFPQIPAYRDQSAAMIKYAFQQYGPGSVFFMSTQSPDLDHILAAAKQAVTSGGGTWLGTASVPFGAPDVSPFALQAGKDHPDYVVFSSAPAETTKIVAQLAQNNTLPKKKILGLTSMPGATYEGGVPANAAAETVSFAATVPAADPKAKVCVDALKAKGVTNPDLVSLGGCSEILMLQSTLKLVKGDITSSSIVAALNSMTNQTLSPLIPALTYSATSHVGLTGLPVVVIKDGVYQSAGSVQVSINKGV
jgi:branched-chain amino acid transport system substrate-binding protein